MSTKAEQIKIDRANTLIKAFRKGSISFKWDFDMHNVDYEITVNPDRTRIEYQFLNNMQERVPVAAITIVEIIIKPSSTEREFYIEAQKDYKQLYFECLRPIVRKFQAFNIDVSATNYVKNPLKIEYKD